MYDESTLEQLEKELNEELCDKTGFFMQALDFILSDEFKRTMLQDWFKPVNKD